MHQLRLDLHNELHARPSIYFDGPACVFHAAFVASGEEATRILLQLVGHDRSKPHGFITNGAVNYKWEKHGEFLTITCVVQYCQGAGWSSAPELLKGITAEFSHLLISLTYVQVLTSDDTLLPGEQIGLTDPAGSAIGNHDASLWSDFILDDDGLCRFILVNKSLNSYRLGRMTRRVLEIETYRMMALLSLPLAQSIAKELEKLELVLIDLTERTSRMTFEPSHLLVEDVASLSTKITQLKAQSQKRFAATIAYADLVSERIGELRESHTGESQRIGVFIERRFLPSVRYCMAIQSRLSLLADSVSSLSDLVQARAQVEVEQQNAKILQSLNARASTQIKIQKAVEGLSVIATAYYLISLLKLIYQGTTELGVIFPTATAILISIPITLAVIWHSRRSIKKLEANE
ncbi:DUF3422 domain-containing protein [Pseudomonas putida]|uniref:DUF3422 domain-containing protein n=1 Tax=Pseudomonas putida TaxID=303 RepID=UPI00236355C4|nr:DUF3422 domain-containing protein [Pseudomonas putida]MDD1963806.1 DUF3422 domain-containing protein [Pseudomonas putida]